MINLSYPTSQGKFTPLNNTLHPSYLDLTQRRELCLAVGVSALHLDHAAGAVHQIVSLEERGREGVHPRFLPRARTELEVVGGGDR